MADTTSDLVMVETPMALLRYLRRENDKEVEENLKYANFNFYNQLLDYAIGKMTYLDDAIGEDRRKLYAVREELEISSEYINDRRNMQARIEQMRKFFGVESAFEFLRLACLSENGYNQAMNLMGQN